MWKSSADELESWKEDGAIGGHELGLYTDPFDVQKELVYHIKMALKGSRKDPVVCIETPYIVTESLHIVLLVMVCGML